MRGGGAAGFFGVRVLCCGPSRLELQVIFFGQGIPLRDSVGFALLWASHYECSLSRSHLARFARLREAYPAGPAAKPAARIHRPATIEKRDGPLASPTSPDPYLTRSTRLVQCDVNPVCASADSCARHQRGLPPRSKQRSSSGLPVLTLREVVSGRRWSIRVAFRGCPTLAGL